MRVQVACGPGHSLVRTRTGVFSWGNGAGYRLGHGDKKDKYKPTRMEAFKDMIVLQVPGHTAFESLMGVLSSSTA